MARTLPVVFAAYRVVNGGWLLWPLRVFLWLTVAGLFLQAVIPLGREVLEPLRSSGQLMSGASKWNRLHGRAAGVMMVSCSMALDAVLWISAQSAWSDEQTVQLRFWPKTLMMSVAAGLGFLLSNGLSLCRSENVAPTPL